MKVSMQQWANVIMNRLAESVERLKCLHAKIDTYDCAPAWRRLLMGGIVYRAYLEYCYLAELDEYVSADLELRE